MANLKRYEFTKEYKCGHEGTEEALAYSEYYAEKIVDERFEKLCPKCFAEKCEKESELARKEADDLDLLELEGTKAQVDWALRIRKDFYSYVEDVNIDLTKVYKKKERRKKRKDEAGIKFCDDMLKLKNYEKAIRTFLDTEDRASKFIEYREILEMDFDFMFENSLKYNFFHGGMGLIIKFIDEYYVDDSDTLKLSVEKEMEDLSIIYPENFNKDIASIEDKDGAIFVTGVSGWDNKKILIDNGFYFIGRAWKRAIKKKYHGDIIDRMAELANDLLSVGYGVKIDSPNYLEIKDKAINGSYEKEVKSWIYIREQDGEDKFFISWRGYSDVYFDTARSLPYAKWTDDLIASTWKGAMVVDLVYYNQVLDFGESYDFTFTDEARAVIDSFKAKEIDKEVISKVDKDTVANKLVDQLERPDEIEDDLLDD